MSYNTESILKSARKTLANAYQNSPPIALVLDANSLAKSTLSLIAPAMTATAIAVSSITGGILGGIKALGSALSNGKKLIREVKASLNPADQKDRKEKILQTSMNTATGVTSLGVSGIFLAGNISGLKGVALNIGAAGSGLLMGLYGLLIVSSSNKIRLNHTFQKELEAQPDKLKWLREHADLELLFGEEVISSIKDEKKTEMEVLQLVNKELFKNKLRAALTILISLLGLSVAITSIVLSAGAAFPIIMAAISALLWMTVDSDTLHNLIGDKCWDVYRKYRSAPSLSHA